MQIRSGQAKVLASNHRRVQFASMTEADKALLASGQLFKFAGETMAWFTVLSVISAGATPEVELTVDYTGAHAYDELANYALTRDFTPIRDLIELSPSDVDIRDAFTQNMRIIDPLLGTSEGGGGTGAAFTKSGNTVVTAGAFTRTITPPSGTFPTPPYGIVATANWPTWLGWSGQTTAQFILTFGVEAPASAQVSWGVFTL
jgi:hypothetical protein